MRHPEWIKVQSTGTHNTKRALRSHGVSTVCEEARCPNQGKCFSNDTATFMILGDICTRNCAFCAVGSGRPHPPDDDEPVRVADAAVSIGLRYVVITSVTRDDLPDGGAGHFAAVISELRSRDEGFLIEVLTPDLAGDTGSLRTVLEAGPDVFNHNIETVRRLYPVIRNSADYSVSLGILRSAKTLYPDIKTKSGIMLGLGEYDEEVVSAMRDLKEAGCDLLTIGQYLRPRKENLPVVEYVRPERFEDYRYEGIKMGFSEVMSSPLTRSSMNAGEMFMNSGGRGVGDSSERIQKNY
jgi:lipoic acid synthetase